MASASTLGGVLVRRMLMLAAVLMAITAVTVALSSDGATDDERAGPAATASPAPSAPSAPSAPGASPVERDGVAPGDAPVKTLRAEEAGQVVRVSEGDVLRLRVVSDELETVQLGTDGPIDVADGDSPAEFDVLAEAGEDREIRLLESGRTIGRLVTQP
jgi:hypothetical protein